ncbi:MULTISPECIES: sensor histidine kinase [Paenibacillus]|uniref:Two-component sensor histidine kinase n=1 Tax=Paenibacillus odorifer TaxID=189426 RepID=A0A1R0WT38_9BACL|nr:sensor histidine kinase [Paenibacillus odorifer]OMD20414.1 two-component sensor histidine kinase [Paenibacillus odorifer]OME26729.1 two-component sensor histidine kinase [Paenibacillus odorifer]OME37200.1 two-component sensor histidine kinase [Paenibacillus odorifer]OME41139.1 two-component sensor histidine kinase [Paenibacillus odorifer]OME43710.1 two-component sensor histidine kinase [Paenibacillus odorifer]
MNIWKRFTSLRELTQSRFSLFAKINCLIILLFIPIIIMYTFSNNVTYDVVSKELQVSNTKQLTFLSSQIDSRINQMMDFALILSRDPNVRAFNGLNIWADRYDQMQTRYVIQEKMVLQSGVADIWPARYAVHSQQNKDVISNYNRTFGYDEDYLKRNMSGKWTYGDHSLESKDELKSFYWFYTDSLAQPGMLTGSNLVIEASFSYENIQNMLDTYKEGGQGDPFFYHKGNSPILNRSADKQLSEELILYLDKHSPENTTQDVVKLNGKNYLVSSVKSSYLDWNLIDVVPLYQILKPISLSQDLFYISMILLFVMGISASILLYRNVQYPIKKLIKGLRRVQRGDYSVRLHNEGRNEFSFLFHRFNDMSHQIQDLIENVFNEKIRAREATLKQLQAQINPHFLYNCLGYIINMAQMKDEDAVVSMAYNLSAYYRYTTRMERETASLDEEIKLLVNYLDIQKLRNARIDYHIEIPENMLSQSVPRLMLQPIVENSVIHGVAKSYSSGEISISGEISNGFCKIYIDDDGPGLNPEQLEALNRKMQEPLQEEMGCGLWNTNQRIMHLFGNQSCLTFKPSPLGGFRTEIIWEIPTEDEYSKFKNHQGE